LIDAKKEELKKKRIQLAKEAKEEELRRAKVALKAAEAEDAKAAGDIKSAQGVSESQVESFTTSRYCFLHFSFPRHFYVPIPHHCLLVNSFS
jgi:hypothetical protein